MEEKNIIFYKNEWLWAPFLDYLILKLGEYDCIENLIPAEYSWKESTYGSRKTKNKVNLYTWGVNNKRINLARAVCINSPTYSVLNFLIIPSSNYNMPFFGVDFVSLPNSHLLVLDFQPSLEIEKQFDKELLQQLIEMKNFCHKDIPIAEKMSDKVASFFSPGLVWSKLPKTKLSDSLILNQLYYSFEQYLNLYLNVLFDREESDKKLKSEIKNGQKFYLEYRKNNDPAKPMLNRLFGKEFTEDLINKVLFSSY